MAENESPFNQYRARHCSNCIKGTTPDEHNKKAISSDDILKCAIVRLSLNGDR